MAALAQLGHIKEKRTDGREPWDPVPEEPVKRRRIAWPGGKISSNKDEALIAYFSKKVERGETLTETQRTAFEHATKGTRFEGKSEEEAMQLAAEEKAVAAPKVAPLALDLESKKDGRKKGKGGKGGRGRGGGAKGGKNKGRGNGKANGGRGRGSGKRALGGNASSSKKTEPSLTKRLDGGLSVGR